VAIERSQLKIVRTNASARPQHTEVSAPVELEDTKQKVGHFCFFVGALLPGRAIFCRVLAGSGAFHSAMTHAAALRSQQAPHERETNLPCILTVTSGRPKSELKIRPDRMFETAVLMRSSGQCRC
jgi:hypothetical protein